MYFSTAGNFFQTQTLCIKGRKFVQLLLLGPIVYFIEGRSLTRQVLNLAGALMEHLLEEIAPLRLWHVSSEEKICTCYSSHLSECINVLTEQFL